MPLGCVLFDLDGTLVDSTADIVASALVGFAEVGVAGVRPEQLRRHLGFPLWELYDVISPDGDQARRERFILAYRRHYAGHCTDSTRPYPGVKETLGALPYRLGVATTKPTRTARQILDALALASSFGLILGSDGLPDKPDPAVLLAAARELHVPPADTVMVGDTDRDVLAARRAGMRAVAVTYGGWSRERLEPLRPDALLDRFEELPGVLASL